MLIAHTQIIATTTKKESDQTVSATWITTHPAEHGFFRSVCPAAERYK